MFKTFLPYLFIYTAILLLVFRNIALNISTNLLDWRDYAAYIWMIFQNFTHITNLDFANFFETNAFYPNKLTLFFLDTMLPQSIIFLPYYLLTKSLVLAFNLTFITTFILNFISSFLFWKQIFKRNLIAFFGGLFIVFSPFFHLELPHFTVMSYWPFFFGLYFLFKDDLTKNKRNYIYAGLCLSAQFLASVYIGIFMIFTILIFFLSTYLFKNINTKPKQIIFSILIILIVFATTSGIFIKGYFDMRHLYNAKRDIREYIEYSAHLSDYIFTTQIDSPLHKSPLMNLWNKLDKNKSSHGSFPGFLIFILAIFSIFRIYKFKKVFFIDIEVNRERSLFFLLIFFGLLFSLGPQLNFNGNYAYIPLPYYFILKFFPGAEALRAVVRWEFLFFLGFTYFSLITLTKLLRLQYHQYLSILIFIIFLLEYIPLNIQASKLSYLTNDHQILKEICSKEKKVLLELPVTHLNAGSTLREGVQYIAANVELASIYHGCFLVNGYSGYDLPDNFKLADTLNKYIQSQNTKEFINELRKRKVDLIKFNKKKFIKELKPSTSLFVENIATESGVKKIGEDLYYLSSSN